MSETSIPPGGPNDLSSRVQLVVEDCMHRRTTGDSVADADGIAAWNELCKRARSDPECLDFVRAHLSDANLSSANLSFASLHKANLAGARLRDANLRDAKFSNATGD